MSVVQTATAQPVPAENRPVERTAPRNGAFIAILIVFIAFEARRRRRRREDQAAREEQAMREDVPPPSV